MSPLEWDAGLDAREQNTGAIPLIPIWKMWGVDEL
jgi:hypothetical protein